MKSAQGYQVEAISPAQAIEGAADPAVDPTTELAVKQAARAPLISQRDYQEALMSQSACTLSGLVHSLDTLVLRIWEESGRRGQGTEWVNRHPLIRLYLEQMVFLNCGSMIDGDSYQSASAFCRKMAGEKFEVGSIIAEELAALIEAYG